MNEEITALHDNNTFEITPLPEGRTVVVGGRWVYAVKLGPNGEEKYKPDLCYIVSMLLSQHMSKPTLAQLGMAKHVLRYVQGTMHYGLKFQKSDVLEVNRFCDSDWGASEDRSSITGYGFQLCSNGPLISWKSRKQQTVALSTCETEYMALAPATQEAKFLRQLFADMQGCNVECVYLHVDNQGAIALARNPVQHQMSKHIDIKYHFVILEIQRGCIQLEYVQSVHNVADIFTKPANKARLGKFAPIRGC